MSRFHLFPQARGFTSFPVGEKVKNTKPATKFQCESTLIRAMPSQLHFCNSIITNINHLETFFNKWKGQQSSYHN